MNSQNKYQPVIGLEIHIELATKTKMFCACSAEYFGHNPNTHVCPVCFGLPGALPVPNQTAIEYALLIGQTLNCQSANFSKFDRKNYFYPDLAKGYQISQYDLPFSQKGQVEIEVDGVLRKIGVRRAHMEEDTGKLIHTSVGGQKISLIDFNRSGVPLVEIVSEPNITSAVEAKAYAAKIQQLVQYIGVSKARIQEGEMRIEPNISMRRAEEPHFAEALRGRQESRRAPLRRGFEGQVGELPNYINSVKPHDVILPNYKVEVKNIGSISAVERAISYEIKRQTKALESGESLRQETRGWDETKGETFVQRIKEEAQDYRYFPEPDIPPIRFAKSIIRQLADQMPELPDQKKKRFTSEFGFSDKDAATLTSTKALADYFEQSARAYDGDAKKIANWILGEFLRYIAEFNLTIDQVKLLPAQIAQLQYLVDQQTISTTLARTIFGEIFEQGLDPQEYIKEKGLQQVSDRDQLAEIVDQILLDNQAAVSDYKKGKKESMGFLLGKTMAKMQGRANPQIVKKILEEKLSG